jgi:hypothetical protein
LDLEGPRRILVRGGGVFCFVKGGTAVLRPITSQSRFFCSDWGCQNGIMGGRSIRVADRTRLATRLIIEGPGRYADGRKVVVFVSLQPWMQCRASGLEGMSLDSRKRHTWSGQLGFAPCLLFFVYGILIMRMDRAQSVCSFEKSRVTKSYVVSTRKSRS